MGGVEAPEWLVPSFTRSVVAAGATAEPEQIADVARALVDRWRAPERRFHNLKHLVMVLTRVDELGQETHEPALVRLAAWYHGAVFDAETYRNPTEHGGEDEAASARLAVDELTALGVPEARARRVGALVEMLLRHSPEPNDLDAAVLSDADLAMLATEPQKYKAYLQNIRAEYGSVDDLDFLRARHHLLTRLLGRKALFHSPLSQGWELVARQNLQAELQRLDRELAAREDGTAGRPAEPGRPVVAAASARTPATGFRRL